MSGQASRRFLRTVAVSVLVCISFTAFGPLPGGPAVAWADSEGDRTARQHFREGEARYAAGKYAAALDAYQAGYDVQPLPGFLVNIAQCQRRMGDLKRARATYGKFLLMAPDSPLAPEVRGLMFELDRLIVDTAAAASAPATAPARTPLTGRALTTRSVAELESMRNEVLPLDLRETAAPIIVAKGAELTLPPVAYDSAADDTGPAAAPASSRRWWLLGGLGVVVVGAAVTLALVLAAPSATTVHQGTLGTLR